MTTLVPLALSLAACFVGACGLVLLKLGDRALWPLGHTKASLQQSFGARYLAMAAMILALTLMAEWRAVSAVIAIGGIMGLFDAYFVNRAGGPAVPHLLAAAACAMLAGAAWWIR
jgi:hypothetical protein